MRIIENTIEFELHQASAITIGKFDGIHLGHQKLLEKVMEKKSLGVQTVVLTFNPSPGEFFLGKKMKELSTREEKRTFFRNMGIDVLIEFPLNKDTADMEPLKFLQEILVNKMKVSYIIAGKDLSFGREGKGDSEFLLQYAKQYHYKIDFIEKVCISGVEISSTLVREEIKKGNMRQARRLIGDAYTVSGIVQHGNKIGRTIGMPTVNLMPPYEKLLPPNGVYFSEIEVEDNRLYGITNIGYKPTISNTNALGVETYIYDFSKDVYGKFITVRLLDFKRPEEKFDSITSLKEQMAKDISEGRYYHQSYGM